MAMTWDDFVLANLANEDNEYILREMKDRLGALQVDENIKSEYCLVYLALARMTDDVPTSNNAYSNMLLTYDNDTGVREVDLNRYVIRMFHAALISDQEAFRRMMSRKSDLSYMDSFPGILRDLVKRRGLDDSSVKMDEVVKVYPEVMLRVLVQRLNYKDLAVLALDNYKYRALLYDLFTRATTSDSSRDALISAGEHCGRLMPSWATRPQLSVVQLVDEIAGLSKDKFSLKYEAVADFVDLMTRMSPLSATMVPNLLQYATRQSEYLDKNNEPVNVTEEVQLSVIPLGRDSLPLSIYRQTSENTGVVQSFMLLLVQAYSA